jgi:hypothetical protein
MRHRLVQTATHLVFTLGPLALVVFFAVGRRWAS